MSNDGNESDTRDSDKSGKRSSHPERRAWRTNDEWARLRERVTARDSDVPVPSRASYHVRRIAPAAAAAAAVVVIAAGVGWRMVRTRPRTPGTPSAAERVATTSIGERLTIHLADSSVAVIGPLSTLRYSVSATDRNIAVDGMAEFSVVHDATRPFRVRAKNAVVTDVGTEFVVRAYAADSGVEVSVTSGVVAVSSRERASDSLALRAGQVAMVAANGQAARVAGGSARALAAWVHGGLVFDDVPLGSVAADLGRWFDVQIRIPDVQLARRRLSAMYSRPTLSGVLDAITVALPVRYERAGNVITILPATR